MSNILGKVAYTAAVAFAASLITLLAVFWLSPEDTLINDDDLPMITMAELALHDHPASCWKAIHGKVYDVTEYIPQHPTPPEVMYEWCGREATEAWEDKGTGRPHSPRAEALLEEYLIGILAPD
jgi:cytochrome b involved in lipid metabolism